MEPLQVASSLSALEHFLEEILGKSNFDLSFRVSAGKPRTAGAALLCVEFAGPDVRLLLSRNAELLFALEHLAVQALRLTPDQHELVSFDADGFKVRRDQAIARSAELAIRQVKESGQLYRFGPMTSRERRLLHLALAPSGLLSQSEGDGPGRHLVLHPTPGV